MHIFSQTLKVQTDVFISKAFTVCDLDSILKIVTRSAVTHSETAKSANMCVTVMFVRFFRQDILYCMQNVTLNFIFFEYIFLLSLLYPVLCLHH